MINQRRSFMNVKKYAIYLIHQKLTLALKQKNWRNLRGCTRLMNLPNKKLQQNWKI